MAVETEDVSSSSLENNSLSPLLVFCFVGFLAGAGALGISFLEGWELRGT